VGWQRNSRNRPPRRSRAAAIVETIAHRIADAAFFCYLGGIADKEKARRFPAGPVVAA
jgi:hypothetical protein